MRLLYGVILTVATVSSRAQAEKKSSNFRTIYNTGFLSDEERSGEWQNNDLDHVPKDDTKQRIKMNTHLHSLSIAKVNAKIKLSANIIDGDIVLSPQQMNIMKSQGVLTSRRKRSVDNWAPKWFDNTIHYYFAKGTHSETKIVVHMAMDQIMKRSCVRFIEDATAFNRIKIVEKDGCWSYIGMQFGEQELSLNYPGCTDVGIASHELLHALSFRHEQSRPDRDDYIRIILSNVKWGYRDQFVKFSNFQVRSYMPYEYGSVMHYGANSFTSGSRQSILTPRAPLYQMTIGSLLISHADLKQLNYHYSCMNKCPKSLACKNQGYQNPANCDVCNCPMGYGGRLCDMRPNDGGKTLNATAHWKYQFIMLSGKSSIVSYRDRLEYEFKTYWIKAPAGKKIQVQMIYNTAYCGFGCPNGFLEIRARPDPELTDARFCCNYHNYKLVKSGVNPTPVVVANRYTTTFYNIRYRYVN